MTTTSQRPSALASFGELSREHALLGQTRMAQLAAWASDVHLLEELLWENGLAEAPDPDVQLAAVGEAVAASLEAKAASLGGDLTARDVLEVAREALLATFDESVHPLVLDRLLPLDHLAAEHEDDPSPEAYRSSEDGATDDVSAGEHLSDEDLTVEDLLAQKGSGRGERRYLLGSPTEPSALDRLEGRTAEQLVAELLATAGDCMAVAEEMLDEGEVEAAARMARQADAASFEAYLTTVAALAGDHRLATVDLRWALARRLDLPRLGIVADFLETAGTTRDRLSSVLGSAEQAALRARLERLPGVRG